MIEDQATMDKIKEYLKLRAGDSYTEAGADRFITAFSNATPGWQQTYLEGMDTYIASVKSGAAKSGESIAFKAGSNQVDNWDNKPKDLK